MRLIGNKGTIDVLDSNLQVTFQDGSTRIAPLKDLEQYIRDLEIYKTDDSLIQFGSW